MCTIGGAGDILCLCWVWPPYYSIGTHTSMLSLLRWIQHFVLADVTGFRPVPHPLSRSGANLARWIWGIVVCTSLLGTEPGGSIPTLYGTVALGSGSPTLPLFTLTPTRQPWSSKTVIDDKGPDKCLRAMPEGRSRRRAAVRPDPSPLAPPLTAMQGNFAAPAFTTVHVACFQLCGFHFASNISRRPPAPPAFAASRVSTVASVMALSPNHTPRSH